MHPEMHARVRTPCSLALALAPAALLGLGIVQPARAENFLLKGDVVTTRVSGVSSPPGFTLERSHYNEAIYALMTDERSDDPCYLAVYFEDINLHEEDSTLVRDRCGSKGRDTKAPGSPPVYVDYADWQPFGPRVFVSGVQVCMNREGTKVKGLRIRGKQLTSDGRVLALDPSMSPGWGTAVTEPVDELSHCNSWKSWAECPDDDQIAVGLISHFDDGEEPRSLTGIVLQCQIASSEGNIGINPNQ